MLVSVSFLSWWDAQWTSSSQDTFQAPQCDMPNCHTSISSSNLIHLLSAPSSDWTPQVPWITCISETPYYLISPCLGFSPLNRHSSFFCCLNAMHLLRPHSSGAVLGGQVCHCSASQILAWGALKNTCCLGPTPRESVISKGPQVITMWLTWFLHPSLWIKIISLYVCLPGVSIQRKRAMLFFSESPVLRTSLGS